MNLVYHRRVIILTPPDFPDYELLDSGDGKRFERFGDYTVVRPDPQCIWKPQLSSEEWARANATFTNRWQVRGKVPERWQLHYKDLHFWAKLSPFKHTGVFPEQAAQWEWITEILKSNPGVKVLNLFGYTGLASLTAAAAGAEVTHVDASRATIGWARDNQQASGLKDKPIRWILDDAVKFCERELRRGVKYDAIIMDPPIYGHGPDGQLWKFQESFPKLMDICKDLLSTKPLFFLINAYAISASSLMLENVLKDTVEGGEIESGELVLQQKSGRQLSTGIFARWTGQPKNK